VTRDEQTQPYDPVLDGDAVLWDLHDFWCDFPKCLGPCNCGRSARLARRGLSDDDCP
jgi:hypothetical protein